MGEWTARLTDGWHGCDCENETEAEERLQLLLQRLSCMIDEAKHTQQLEARESRGVPCAVFTALSRPRVSSTKKPTQQPIRTRLGDVQRMVFCRMTLPVRDTRITLVLFSLRTRASGLKAAWWLEAGLCTAVARQVAATEARQ